jgi:hypothetical protein
MPTIWIWQCIDLISKKELSQTKQHAISTPHGATQKGNRRTRGDVLIIYIDYLLLLLLYIYYIYNILRM